MFAACIPGYWGSPAERDDTAEDGLLITLCTDPRFVRRREEHVRHFLDRSRKEVQYSFLQNPGGGSLDRSLRYRLWGRDGEPDGGFDAICRVPIFGIMTDREWRRVRGRKAAPPLPDYLFRDGEAFADAPHRIILCREDVRKGLAKFRRHSSTLSSLLGQTANISHLMLAAQLRLLLAEMRRNKRFQVALVPRSAFGKPDIEFVSTGTAARRWAGCWTAARACLSVIRPTASASPPPWTTSETSCTPAGKATAG